MAEVFPGAGQHEDHKGVIGEEGSGAVSGGKWLGVTTESRRGWHHEAVRTGPGRCWSGLEHLMLLLCGLADDLSIPGLNGLDHHRLFGVDLRTPLLRAGFSEVESREGLDRKVDPEKRNTMSPEG